MPNSIDTIASVIFHRDENALADLSRVRSNWLPFYQEHGRGMLVDTRYLEKIGGPHPVEMVLHLGTLHKFVFNADWKAFSDEIARGIGQLRPCANREIDWDEFIEATKDVDTNTLMQELASKVDNENQRLVNIDTGSDCYDFAVVETLQLGTLAAALDETDEGRLCIVCNAEFSD